MTTDDDDVRTGTPVEASLWDGLIKTLQISFEPSCKEVLPRCEILHINRSCGVFFLNIIFVNLNILKNLIYCGR